MGHARMHRALRDVVLSSRAVPPTQFGGVGRPCRGRAEFCQLAGEFSFVRFRRGMDLCDRGWRRRRDSGESQGKSRGKNRGKGRSRREFRICWPVANCAAVQNIGDARARVASGDSLRQNNSDATGLTPSRGFWGYVEYRTECTLDSGYPDLYGPARLAVASDARPLSGDGHVRTALVDLGGIGDDRALARCASPDDPSAVSYTHLRL